MSFPQTTPVRPVPGAFLNTPAVASRFQAGSDPVRRQLFAGSEANPQPMGVGAKTSTTTTTSRSVALTTASSSKTTTSDGLVVPSVLPPPRSENVPPVVKAAKAINSFLQADERFPDLDSYCRQGASSEYDVETADSPVAPFHKTQMYPIPNQVFDHYNAGELQTLMGLFAEINHAWVVIDNSLFLWDYTHPDPELIGFEDQPHTIHAVALVPPKPGIFVNTITHILVVATSSEMILLGVSATDTPAGTKAVSLYQTKMLLPLRGNDVRVITGSANGRIFFGGSSDIDINELYYQSEEKWFSNRCGKINHTNPGWSSVVTLQSGFWSQKSPEHLVDIVIDDSRNLVYTLSSRSTIRTYHMEAPDRLNKVIEKEKVHCLRDIAHMISHSKLLNDRATIVAISPISKQEASKLHLMALTNTGCRLFFSATNASSYLYGSQSNMAPQSMQVQFIKFPPSQNPRRSGYAGGETLTDLESSMLTYSRQGARFAPGYFLDFVSKESNPNADSLFVSGPETGRIKETSPTTPLKYFENASWIDIGSRAEAVGLITKPFSAAGQPFGFGNELAVQFDDPPSEFAVLTNTGVHIIRRRRFVDIFASAIRGAVGDEGYEQVCRRFIQLYGRVETVSTALAVACGHGGDSRPGAARAIDQATEDRARSVFVDFGGQPTITETDGASLTTDSVRLSSRHDALAVYLARLIRKLWKAAVIKPGVSPTGGVIINSTIPLSKLSTVQENLERLRRFLDSNRGLIQGLSGPSDLQHVSSRQEEVALQAEHQALHALQKLMESISEGISFVLMLFDERVADIFTRLDDTARQQLKDLTYEKLFSQADGKDLAKLLVKAIVNRNIESGSNVETVADALRRRCGSFCSPDDVVIFKAQEQLKRASDQPPNTSQSRSLLHESLRLFEKVAGSLTFANLQGAVTQYVDLKYYAGAIQLCLVVAREKDRGNTALSWINDGKPSADPRANAFNDRKRCYDMIHDVLRHLDAASSSEPEMIDGRLTLIATKRLEAYDVVNGSDDEVFHFDLYEWYIQQGWTGRILAIESPHVITFLQRLAGTNVEHADLLCRFYTNRSRFFDAAEVQAQLANSDFPIGIKDRIRLLSLAKANANVATSGVSRQQQQLLNHEVTELLEIAHIQDDLLERLKADERIDSDRKVEIQVALKGKIQGLSELFNDYADQAGYYDLCLLIYHAADYRNHMTISGTWSNLIQQTHDEIMSRLENSEPGMPSPPLPYESVTSKIQNIAHRTSLDSFIFPIQTLLPELCRYAVAYQQDTTIGADPTWPVQLFLTLGVSHDMIVRVLENIFDTQDYGFSGSVRNRIIELIVFVVNDWSAEVRRRGGGGKGGSIGPSVVELLKRCDAALPPPGHGNNLGGADLADVRRVLKALKREVDGLAQRVPTGTLRFA
ncbi:Non-repetitive/WGA-negative nucleoporin C-terminal-domain-containing protein [Ilyonectria robusta]|uniref:Non-repetitive/WGA-negative nucleoporin C-terminal-domain-containing protein n=1 Tax=Ilyonectria robusta TaxID=1079257 RepID=UPI001E8E26D1|nr:Non-repetitive/WGA-negative nucleoporin C-terminal-domain-containing protein [Ilyonectria robusta]KAH8687014.1 Non-repetitive/WGA-negative nucleoporin C-terminal-domain-containing protein [Ilyonectria robusta]